MPGDQAVAPRQFPQLIASGDAASPNGTRPLPEDRASNEPGVVSDIAGLLKALLTLEAAVPIDLLRSEARLLALIKQEPGHPVKYYMNKSTLSYRGFFNTLNALVSAGLVREVANSADRRQKLLS